MAAEGYTAGEIAEVEGLTAEQVEELLGDERSARLVKLALHLIEEAISLGHVRVGFYVVREKLLTRHAAEVVVDQLIKQRAKAAEPLPPAPSRSPSPRLPAHPANRMVPRAQFQLMLALLGENRVREEGKARAARRDLAAAKARRLAGGLPPHLAERRPHAEALAGVLARDRAPILALSPRRSPTPQQRLGRPTSARCSASARISRPCCPGGSRCSPP